MRVSNWCLLAVLPAISCWTDSTSWAESRSSSSAADHSNLTHYLDDSGIRRPITTREEWKRRRAQIVRGMEKVMGPLPEHGRPNAVRLEPRENESKRQDFPGIIRSWISIASGDEKGDRIPAHLYVPMGIGENERRPAMLALHPTSTIGKLVVAGEGPRPNRNYAVELARRGYVVIAPDYPGFGDYADYDFSSDAYVSGTMKGIVNHIRCADYLQTRPDVDPERIGVIGHSLGGHNAIFAAVFDARLKIVVSSCGWNPFHDYYGGKIAGWSSDRYMPRLRDEFALDPDQVPFDFYEVVAALAPRPFFSNSPLRDKNFDVIGVMRAIPRCARIYSLLGAEDELQARYPNAGHDFPPQVRREAYQWIDGIFKFDPSDPEVPRKSAAGDDDDPAANDSGGAFTGPWDVAALSRPPRARWGKREGQLREVYYEGLPLEGHRTEIFAYYARPAEQREGEGRPFPAMLLVHGGGGRAFAEWARLWAERGYVALAMDTAGQGPDRKRHPLAGPPQNNDFKFRNFELSSIDDQWTTHAVAAILLGHSLLAVQADVDADRIGITGISWGGYLTCIASGIDKRLKVSVPVYGCGFLENSPSQGPRLRKMSSEQRDLWVACFDPSRYLSGVQCPILFVNGTNDFAYPLDSYQKSYRMVPGETDLCVRMRMPHGHKAGWSPVEIGIFVDSILGNGDPLPRVRDVDIDGGIATAKVTSRLPIEESEIHFTHDEGPWTERKWKSETVQLSLEEETIQAELPNGDGKPLTFYFSVTDERGALASSPLNPLHPVPPRHESRP